MDYIREYRRFIYSHYLADGVRITIGVLLPSLIMGYYGHLQSGIFLSLGALSSSITDNPGPIHHRRNALFAVSAIIFFVALATGFALQTGWLFPVILPIFCFLFSMIGVFGARVTSIGVAALLVMVMMTHEGLRGWEVIYFALYLLAGSGWYALLSLLLYSLRPYRIIQQSMGEYVLASANYLRARAGFYAGGVNINASYERLMQEQVNVQQKQELTAELLFKTRGFVRESTHTSRILMMIFLDISDLLERSMASHLDYQQLHRYFDETGILKEYRVIILSLADELDEIGIALNSGKTSGYDHGIDAELKQERKRLEALRVQQINPDNLEGFISLRHILDSIDDIAARIRTLHQYTSYDKSLRNISVTAPDPDKYVTRQTIDPAQFWSNFSLHSNIFRHSLRISVAAMVAFTAGQLLPVGRGYWILLTVIIILKPGYSLSKKRNIQRLTGTLIGVSIGWVTVYFIHSNTILLMLLAVCMIGGFSFVRRNYLLGVIMITLYLLFMFHILEPNQFSEVVRQRIIDTLIGCIIAFLASYFLPPVWERFQLRDLMQELVKDIAAYYEAVATVFTGGKFDRASATEKRKKAWVSLANVSDAFTRMLSEPRSQRRDAKEFHRFVVSSHMLVSHLATLSYYAATLKPEFRGPEFQPLLSASLQELENAALTLANPNFNPAHKYNENPQRLLDQKVSLLIRTRQEELVSGQLESVNKQYISTFKSIADQFYFVYKTSIDIQKISRNLQPDAGKLGS